MAEIDKFFNYMAENDISDFHLSSGMRPPFRQHGDLKPASDQILTHDIVKKLSHEILNDKQIRIFEEKNDLDFAHELAGVARFRANYYMQQRGISSAFRLIPNKINTLDGLGLPEKLKDFAGLNNGLVLITGPTGSGKSTTLAAIIDHINKTRSDHIITIEDPVEFVHQSDKCLIQHREVENAYKIIFYSTQSQFKRGSGCNNAWRNERSGNHRTSNYRSRDRTPGICHTSYKFSA